MSVIGTDPLPRGPGIAPPRKTSSSFDGASNVVFFGKALSVECQRCGAFCSTNLGHKYCAHVTCPIALKEMKRRKRKRTSTLEQVYIPLGKLGARKAPSGADAGAAVTDG